LGTSTSAVPNGAFRRCNAAVPEIDAQVEPPVQYASFLDQAGAVRSRVGDMTSPFRVTQLTFNGGVSVDTSEADIVVIVGPNNTGNSRTVMFSYAGSKARIPLITRPFAP
jgi:hypothetical protein